LATADHVRAFSNSQKTRKIFTRRRERPFVAGAKPTFWLDRVKSDEQHTYYRCPNHAIEVWKYGPGENQWTRLDPYEKSGD
jgi:hypothetical protein